MSDGMPAGENSARGARKLVIAIDGPAGSGKSTLAALLARRYNYTNIETGAMYRALAFKALEGRVSLDDEKKLAALAAQSKIELTPNPEGNRVLLDGKGFFTNDPASHPDSIGVPAGHPPLTAFLGAPLISGGRSHWLKCRVIA